MTKTIGFGVVASVGPEVAAEIAPEVERLGYGTFWSNDGASRPGLPLLAAAQRTSRGIRVCVGVIPCALRAPAEVARTISELGVDAARVTVGIGAGRVERPVDAVRAHVAELRTVLPAGARIAIAALGPRMCRLAGELADVVLLNWMTPTRIEWARERIAEGARRGSRRTLPTVASYVRVTIGADARERLLAAATEYSQHPSYRSNFQAMGVDLATVGIAVSHADQVPDALAPYRAVLDETVARALTVRDDAASVLAIARAAAP